MKNINVKTNSESKQPSVVNLFFLGSGQHRDQFSGRNERGNLIYETYLMCQKSKQHDGTPQFSHLIDGVGGKPGKLPNGEPNPNPMAGQYVYVPDSKEPGKGTKVVDKKHSDTAAFLLGNAMGFGVDENTQEAIAYIDQLTVTGYPPKVVNLTGFSRGAYTAIIVANILNQMYPDVKVNLCLFDPVAGPTLKGNPMATIIPPNVNKALIFYQKHEEGLLFEAQSKNRITVADPTKTAVHYEVVAGGHNAATKYDAQGTSHAHRLASGLTFEAFQNDFGVEFVDGAKPVVLKNSKQGKSRRLEIEELDKKDMTSEGRLLLYMGMKQQDKSYAKQAKSRIIRRDHLTQASEEYVRDSRFFYSQRHRELFKQVLPKTFSYRFEMNQGNYSKEDIQKELKEFAVKNYELYVALKSDLKEMGFEELEHNVFSVPEKPMGSYLIEQSAVLNNQKLVSENDELGNLLWSITSAINYAQVRTSTMRQAKIDDVANNLKAQVDTILKEEPSREKQIAKVENAVLQASERLQKDVGSCKLLAQLKGILNDPVTYAEEATKLIDKNMKKAGEHKGLCETIKQELKQIVADPDISKMQKNARIDSKLTFLQTSVEKDNPKFSQQIKQLRSERRGQPHLLEKMVKRVDSFVFKTRVQSVLLQIKSFFGAASVKEKQDLYLQKEIASKLRNELALMNATSEAVVSKEKIKTVIEDSLKDVANLKDSKSQKTNVDDLYNVVMKCYREVAPIRAEKMQEQDVKKEVTEPRAGMESPENVSPKSGLSH